jgi:hypothetical protein
MENADPAVKQLAEIAYDEKQSAEIRLKATLALIDRAGLSPRSSVDVELTAKPYETVFDGYIEMDSGGSRAAFRGEPEPLALTAADELPAADDHGLGDHLVVDAEVVDPMTRDDDERGSAFDSAPVFNPFAPAHPPDGLMTIDAAVSAAAEMQRRSAVSRRAQRALPRGRT